VEVDKLNEFFTVCLIRKTRTLGPVAGKRIPRRRRIWTQYRWRHREPADVVIGEARRSEFCAQLSSHQHCPHRATRGLPGPWYTLWVITSCIVTRSYFLG